jgi:hypothetical protein
MFKQNKHTKGHKLLLGKQAIAKLSLNLQQIKGGNSNTMFFCGSGYDMDFGVGTMCTSVSGRPTTLPGGW